MNSIFLKPIGELEKKHPILAIKLRLSYVIFSIKNLKNPHLGDIVKYNTKKWTLIQGVDNPYWDLSELNVDYKNRIIIKKVHKDNFEPEISFRNLKNRFFGTYNWLMSSWYIIDFRNIILKKEKKAGKHFK